VTIFDDVRAELTDDPGARLFTVLAWEGDTATLRRVATSHDAAYPVGAEKRMEVSNGWLAGVVGERRSFLAPDLDGIAEVFADVDLIASLGCGSVINVPIVDGAEVVGVLAILDAAGRYDEESVRAAEAVIARHDQALVAAMKEARA
jgi:hypothetical protein